MCVCVLAREGSIEGLIPWPTAFLWGLCNVASLCVFDFLPQCKHMDHCVKANDVLTALQMCIYMKVYCVSPGFWSCCHDAQPPVRSAP